MQRSLKRRPVRVRAEIAELREYWHKDFKEAGSDWQSIQHALNRAIQPINVRSVNQRAGAASLDYKIHKETGLRVIAVGGNSLSERVDARGLEHELLLSELAYVRYTSSNGPMVWISAGL